LIAEGQGAPPMQTPPLDVSRLGLRGADAGFEKDVATDLGTDSLTLAVGAGLLLNDVAPALRIVRHVRGNDRSFCLVARDAHHWPRCVRVRLKTEDDFHGWLDGGISPAKLRVVMRSDGLEVVGAHGKVPGLDRFGPSILPINGQPDFLRLNIVAAQMKRQEPEETEMGILASAATPFDLVVRAAACLNGPDAERFSSAFIVVP
jgi:hypothetical protein